MGNFEFKKKFGQNFLTDENILSEIVRAAGVGSSDTVLEIGAGKGALTEVLSKYAARVISFEIDSDLRDYLTEKFSGSNVELFFDDIMSYSEEKINSIVGRKFKLVANLPYYITSPIITSFLSNSQMESLTVMVQEEVADRIVALPKTKSYGVLSIICQVCGKPEKVFRVTREKFYPVPKVDSAVVHIERSEKQIAGFDKFMDFVKKCFAMRRKKLSSNLCSSLLSKDEVERLLVYKGYSPSVRAEELSIRELENLFELFYDKLK